MRARLKVWLLAAGGFVALLSAYAGGRVGTHQWCISGEGDGPAYCEYSNGHHGIYLALGLAFLALAVLLFVLARRVKRRPERSAAEGA